mmetsp:Transcript_41355/g.96594  ORF Transcript_41355/g.96594 Transcript_41355/m.96594 type:complete len:276 (+) Transcript_41355:145-972(+)
MVNSLLLLTSSSSSLFRRPNIASLPPSPSQRSTRFCHAAGPLSVPTTGPRREFMRWNLWPSQSKVLTPSPERRCTREVGPSSPPESCCSSEASVLVMKGTKDALVARLETCFCRRCLRLLSVISVQTHWETSMPCLVRRSSASKGVVSKGAGWCAGAGAWSRAPRLTMEMSDIVRVMCAWLVVCSVAGWKSVEENATKERSCRHPAVKTPYTQPRSSFPHSAVRILQQDKEPGGEGRCTAPETPVRWYRWCIDVVFAGGVRVNLNPTPPIPFRSN